MWCLDRQPHLLSAACILELCSLIHTSRPHKQERRRVLNRIAKMEHLLVLLPAHENIIPASWLIHNSSGYFFFQAWSRLQILGVSSLALLIASPWYCDVSLAAHEVDWRKRLKVSYTKAKVLLIFAPFNLDKEIAFAYHTGHQSSCTLPGDIGCLK